MYDNHSPILSRAKFKRVLSALLLGLAILAGLYLNDAKVKQPQEAQPTLQGRQVETTNPSLGSYKNALEGLGALPVKGRAPKTGYTRSQFGEGWQAIDTCDTRNKILARDMTEVIFKPSTCVVVSGILQDPYTAKSIVFNRGAQSSSLVQIDHIVALSDAWQKGAQLLSPSLRIELANDPLELLAVDGPANQQKGDGDAATWLPSNKNFRCSYVSRQISVKIKYSLWITSAEKDAMLAILKNCPNTPLST